MASVGCKIVRPLMSTDYCEAHRRVIGLYRAFYRYIPYIVKFHDIPKNEEQVRWKIRELFYRNACVTDIRVIDLLVIKGFMDYEEIKNQWAQKCHVMAWWNPTWEPKPVDFLNKFIQGLD
ncbi:hypothetical protein MSG28_010262 [Choristoneura fumiferana]|uniref:Uncharacterized protein n=1 Tax=Choristoneura fumiferana TaxID=7141 RepID=A0ACC0KL46_CHOFU|nr:hypothetical protein MSG28_010262 [Choristoneura fumiferana]